MCGILGFYFKSKFKNKNIFTDDPSLKTKLKHLITHRGPDNQDFYINEEKNVGLFHSRLSIIDLSDQANQPMATLDGKFKIIFNGEIYNFKEIKENLDQKTKIDWKTKSDTEVILNLFSYNHNQGLDIKKTLEQLNGIFAFSIYDKDSGILTICRDSLGVKPLYIASTSYGFFFSSEIKSLMPFIHDESKDIISNDIDPNSIDKYLTYLFCPGDGTPFKNIKKLCPGQYIQVLNGEIIKKVNWNKSPYLNNSNFKSKIKTNNKEIIEQTKSLLRKSVHRQMISDAPLGSFLSGGLDSSSIVAFARELNPNIKCFSIDMGDNYFDNKNKDLKFAKEVAKHLNIPLQIVEVNPSIFQNEIENMIWNLDEPISDPAPLNVMFISKLARKQGIKVLLSGTGGDDIFSGYRRHQAIYLEKYLNLIPDALKNKLSNGSRKIIVKNEFLRRFRKLISTSEKKGNDKIISLFNWINRRDLIPLYSIEFLKSLKEAPSKPMHNYLDELPANLSNLKKLLFLEQRFFLGDHNLIYTDKLSMSEGVEVRVPFLDQELVEFVNSIPDNLKQQKLQSKWILKKCMEDILPKDIIYRKKTGFGLPLRDWIKKDMREWLRSYLCKRNIEKRGIFNFKAIEKLIKDNENNRIDATYTLFSLACLEIWFQKFKD